MKKVRQNATKLAFVMSYKCLDITEVRLNKHLIQESYEAWSDLNQKNFMNWGISDKKIYNKFIKSNYDFTSFYNEPDINSVLLLFYLLSPLIEMHFFNKRILDIGSGNGIGLKMGSEFLKTQYALGVDLTHKLVSLANANYSKENKVNYIQSDAECLPLENESFDIITNIESSHLYPRIEYFFDEIERVLTPGGYFCYTDADFINNSQSQKLENYIKKSKHLKIVKRHDITKMVQASIYQRVIVNEEAFFNFAMSQFNKEDNNLYEDILYLALSVGLSFLPWWKIRFKNQEMHYIAKVARKSTFWKKKYYFYYLIQKNK